MRISVRAHLHYTTASACDGLMQIEAHSDAAQTCVASNLQLPTGAETREIQGEDGIGRRRWVTIGQDFTCQYDATFDIQRAPATLSQLAAARVNEIPGDVTKYVLPSRYCRPDAIGDILTTHFAGLAGGALIEQVSDWINTTFTYDIYASHGGTTSTDSLTARAGVCRDYAHVLIAMARAVGIPARYASVYAPNVTPQDFHAVAQVYLDGAWHFVDPTGMAHASDTLLIGVGRDAADVSFLTSFGAIELVKQAIEVFRI